MELKQVQMTLSDTLGGQVVGRRGHVQSFLGVGKLTECNWFIATRTDPARTNLSHEPSALTLLLAKQAYTTGLTLVNSVRLCGL